MLSWVKNAAEDFARISPSEEDAIFDFLYDYLPERLLDLLTDPGYPISGPEAQKIMEEYRDFGRLPAHISIRDRAAAAAQDKLLDPDLRWEIGTWLIREGE